MLTSILVLGNFGILRKSLALCSNFSCALTHTISSIAGLLRTPDSLSKSIPYLFVHFLVLRRSKHTFDAILCTMQLVMLTEPLNASIISFFVVHEHPPSVQTILGVAVVLLGCGVVISQENSELVRTRESICKMLEDGDEDEHALDIRKSRRLSALVLSNAARLAPAIPELEGGGVEFMIAGAHRHSWHPLSRQKFSVYGSVDISGTCHL